MKVLIRYIIKNIIWWKKLLSSYFPKNYLVNKLDDRALIIAASGIGDALMITPVIHKIYASNEKCKIGVVANTANYQIFSTNPHVDKVYILYELVSFFSLIKYLKLIYKIRLENYRYSINAIPGNTVAQMLIPLLSGIKISAKINKQFTVKTGQDYNFLFSHLLSVSDEEHRVVTNLKLLQLIKTEFEINDTQKYFFLPQYEIDFALNTLKNTGFSLNLPIVGFHIGCGGTRYGNKRWPLESFSELGNILFKQYNAQILLTGGKSELILNDLISKKLLGKKYFAVGQYGILQTAAFIKVCDIFISNDSGLMHLANALGVKVIALFGPTNPQKVGPLDNSFIVLQKGFKTESIMVSDVLKAFDNLYIEYPIRTQ